MSAEFDFTSEALEQARREYSSYLQRGNRVTPTPPLPPEDADVEAVKAGIGIVGNNVTAWAALNRLAARLQEAKRERDEVRLPSVEEVQDVFEKARLRVALAAAEAREAVLREALNDADGILQWFASNYPKAMREMPTSLWQRLEFIRAALATADPEASK